MQLQSKISVLEGKKQELENQLTRLDLQERKNDVLVHGISETGPNENIEDTVAKFSKETLKIPDSENLCFNKVYRMGKPPHLVPAPVKNPRVIMVKLKNLKINRNCGKQGTTYREQNFL